MAQTPSEGKRILDVANRAGGSEATLGFDPEEIARLKALAEGSLVHFQW